MVTQQIHDRHAVRKASLHPDIERAALVGMAIYPMSRYSKAGCFEGAAAAATSDLDVLTDWARDFPDCNWRAVCGPSGLFALDVDMPGTHKADGFAALLNLTRKHGPLPPRPMTKTGGSGGAALFFKHEGQTLRGASGTPAPGIDPHRGRQAVVIPPSVHPVTGGAYTWRVPIWDMAPPSIPEWLVALLAPVPEPDRPRHPWTPTTERAQHAVMKAIHAVQDAPPTTANDTLNRQAFRLGAWCAAGLLMPHEATDVLMSAAQARQIPQREARDTIKSGLTAGLKKPVQAR